MYDDGGVAEEGDSATDRSRPFLLVSIVVTIALFYLPFGHQVGFPLVLISTVAHEMGHALTALLVGGSVDRVEVNLDGSGVAYTATTGRLDAALVSAGGLVGPAIAAALCFVSARSARIARWTLFLLTALLLLSLVFWMRNPFGVVYVLALAAALAAVGWRATAHVAQLVLVFVAVQLALSVYSRGDYLFTEFADVGGARLPSDVSHMSDALAGPYWFWGGVCAVFSAAVLVLGIWLFLRRPSEKADTSTKRF